MSQICAILLCKRTSCALCHSCQQNICLSHLKEHQDLLISELNPLVDQINTLGDRLKAVNIDEKIASGRQKLEEWRVECHQKIDRFFKQKTRELDRHLSRKIDEQREEISRTQSKMAELIREQQATRHDLDLLSSTMIDLERKVNKIVGTSFDIRCHSLKIDDKWIEIEELNGHRIDLSNLPPVYKKIDFVGKYSLAVASDGHVLLMQHQENICLVDRTLTVVKQTLWNNGNIYDICWSSVLNQFIVIQENNVFLVDRSKLSIEKVSAIQLKNWFSCACSDKSLFLSTKTFGSFIVEYSLLPSIQLIKHWKSPDTCQEDEAINCMRYNSGTFALTIGAPRTKALRIELKNSNTLQQLWSLQLNTVNIQKCAFFCCLTNGNEWLVADHGNRDIIHIGSDGELKATCAYSSMPVNLCIFSSNILVVVCGQGMNFHKF